MSCQKIEIIFANVLSGNGNSFHSSLPLNHSYGEMDEVLGWIPSVITVGDHLQQGKSYLLAIVNAKTTSWRDFGKPHYMHISYLDVWAGACCRPEGQWGTGFQPRGSSGEGCGDSTRRAAGAGWAAGGSGWTLHLSRSGCRTWLQWRWLDRSRQQWLWRWALCSTSACPPSHP